MILFVAMGKVVVSSQACWNAGYGNYVVINGQLCPDRAGVSDSTQCMGVAVSSGSPLGRFDHFESVVCLTRSWGKAPRSWICLLVSLV